MNKQRLLNLKAWVKRGYGSRCKDFHYACFICQIYMAIDILEDTLDDVCSRKEVGRKRE